MTRGRSAYAPGYVGARGRISLSEALKLDPAHWAIQPKLDGAYVVLSTDAQGAVSSVRTRTGRTVAPRTHGLRGQIVGPPLARLVGEIALWTEGGIATASNAGYVICELHDILRIGSEDLSGLPYRERRDRLWRAHADLEHRGIPGRGYATDRRRRRHDPESGQYVDEGPEVPMNWRRCPVIEQLPPRRAEELWARVGLVPWTEGIVAVALDAPVGRRRSKLKCKPLFTVDCEVLDVGHSACCVKWPFTGWRAAMGLGGHHDLTPGEIVEVAYEGFQSNLQPRFARIVRRRADIGHCCRAFQVVDLSSSSS